VAIGAVLALASIPSCGGGQVAHRAPPAPSSAAESPPEAAVAEPVLPSLRPLEVGAPGVPAPPEQGTGTAPAPIRLQIPAIGVDSSLVALDLNRDGTVEVPSDFNRPGWYRRSPAPGDQGAAVILGHLDSNTGPAVFWRLSALRPGDTVRVTRQGGIQLEFAVQRTVSYPVDSFPSFDVYGATARPELRLITCGGTYSASRRRYLSNVVAFAGLSA
jgi:sortase (surface protein transpeptidase)